jgi:DNA repair exonuclease SbcCD nuclease subunit
MGTVRFVHCADLHLDTPFRGVASVSPDMAAVLARATFASWDNIVALALDQRVDFVVVAGDVFDSTDRSLRAQFAFRDGLARLAVAGIASFVAFGNHDPLGGWSSTLEWPDLSHRFGGHEVDVFPVTRDGHRIATVHGISFAREAVTEDLSMRFAAPDPSVPSVAVLHANVGGDAAHAPYAPATVERLASRGFTYWALGHVHAQRVLRAQAPAVVYPGCSQSRQPNETGAKGCCLVTLQGGSPQDVRFVATDAVRYRQSSVDVSACLTIDGICRAAADACRAISEDADGRDLVVRLTLTGRTALHRELDHATDLADLADRLGDELASDSPRIWLESLQSAARGTYDVDSLTYAQDLSGDIVRTYAAVLRGDPEALAGLRAQLAADMGSWSSHGHLADLGDDDLRQLAVEAMHRTLDLTVDDD